ncbi:Panacea domain-containing protein [Streptococcus phocae subsp. phocae]
MNTVVFSEKDFLVNFLYQLLDNPTQIKVQKTLYLLFAFYGATYGKLETEEDNEFSEQNYPKELFKATFEAWKYGPVETDVYVNEKKGSYSDKILNEEDINEFFKTPELKNVRDFIENIVEQTNQIDDFSLVDRTHQDDVWLDVYKDGENHITMDNKKIIQEYIERYV